MKKMLRFPVLAVSMFGCSVNPLDPDQIGCMKTALGDTCADDVAGNGGGNGNGAGGSNGATVSVCQSACTGVDDCVGIQTINFNTVEACVTACDAGQVNAGSVQCVADAAGNCDAVQACLQPAGGDTGTACGTACSNLDQCTEGGLESQGFTISSCTTGCDAGQLGSQTVVDCVANASSCSELQSCGQ